MAQVTELAPASNNPLISITNLKVYFPIGQGFLGRPRGIVAAVDGVDFTIRRGETLGIVGESGSGKTTLGLALIRLIDPTSGTIFFDGVDLASLSGEELRKMRRRMQMIFQDPYGSFNPRMNMGAILAEPLKIHRIAQRSKRTERVHELLRLVGLDPKDADRFPHAFSGGQRQRIGVARALAVEPDFIVCDEPTSSLDVSIRSQILNLLVQLRERLGLTYVFISHDLGVVRHISDRVAVMYLGRVLEIGMTSTVFSSSAHPYTRALLSVIPVPDPKVMRSRRRVILPGDLPSLSESISGCRFRSRCWLYEQLSRPEICQIEDPTLHTIEFDHFTACHFANEAAGSDIGLVDRPSADMSIFKPLIWRQKI